MKKIVIYLMFISIVFSLGFIISRKTWPAFNSLSVEDMRQRIIQEQNIAIKKAVAKNQYNCCVEPACTMCFMEANEWNNHQAGTCACAELIKQGKQPCPQCKRILSQSDNPSQ